MEITFEAYIKGYILEKYKEDAEQLYSQSHLLQLGLYLIRWCRDNVIIIRAGGKQTRAADKAGDIHP